MRASLAARLTHIKQGYYTPPSAPVFVPGLRWLAVILVGRDQQLDPPELAAMRWWTSRGPRQSFKSTVTPVCLLQFARLSISDPVTITKQRNAANISWIIAEIVRNRAPLAINALDPAKLR